jgi:hypothetical protein
MAVMILAFRHLWLSSGRPSDFIIKANDLYAAGHLESRSSKVISQHRVMAAGHLESTSVTRQQLAAMFFGDNDTQ